jgi:hypothetical protein
VKPRSLTARILMLAAGFTLAGTLAAPAAVAAAGATAPLTTAPLTTAPGTTSARTEAAAVQTTGGSQRAVPDLLGCTDAPTPEVPGRGVVGFFESPPKTLPPAADPFMANSTTSIYEQYGYAGLRWNTYDLGCGPDLARSPDAAIGTAVANWIIALPKAAVAATGAVVSAAFAPDFLSVFDPLIEHVVETLRHAVFEQWAFVVMGGLGLLLLWRSRQAALASTAAAIGWALLIMVLVTMVFRWPLVAGTAADQTVTSTLGAVSGGLNDKAPGAVSDAGTEATAGMHEALLYQAWLGGTFGDANSEVARQYGPVIFDATALTWAQAQVMRTDPAAGQNIIKAKQAKFKDAAKKIKEADPDAYDYLTGRRSDSRVGYAVLAGLATLCAVPFLFFAGLLVLGALIIVRFGVMLFPAFATLGLFPTMRSLVTGIGSTMVAALINAMVFGIGAAVTVLGMGVLLAPNAGTPPWLDIILMLLLTIVMWVALRPFRRLTQMVSSNTNHFAATSSGVSTTARSAARTSSKILTTAIGTFLGVSATQRGGVNGAADEVQVADGVPQRAEANVSYQPLVVTSDGSEGAALAQAPAEAAAGRGSGSSKPATVPGLAPAAGQPAALANALQVNAGSVTVVRTVGPAAGAGGRTGQQPMETGSDTDQLTGSRAEMADTATAPAGTGSGARSDGSTLAAAGGRGPARAAPAAAGSSTGGGEPATGGRYESSGSRVPRDPNRVYSGPVLPAGSADWDPATDGENSRLPTDRGFARTEGAQADDFDLDELNEVFRPDPARQR